MAETPKLDWKEEFGRFFEAPTREGLREVLKCRTGEYNFLDFKEKWPEIPKLARHILAFSNSGNGCMVFGVSERDDKSFEVNGLEELQDKTKIEESVNKFLPFNVSFGILDFVYEESEYERIKGKKFQVLLIVHNPESIPLLARADGKDIYSNRIYVRTNTSSTEANHEQVQELIQKKIETSTNKSPVKQEILDNLTQLKTLYDHKKSENPLLRLVISPFLTGRDFNDFIVEMIEKKEKFIERFLLERNN